MAQYEEVLLILKQSARKYWANIPTFQLKKEKIMLGAYAMKRPQNRQASQVVGD